MEGRKPYVGWICATGFDWRVGTNQEDNKSERRQQLFKTPWPLAFHFIWKSAFPPLLPFQLIPIPFTLLSRDSSHKQNSTLFKNSFPGEICTTSMFFYGPSYKLKNDSTSVQPREPMSLLVCLHNRGEGLLTEARGRPKKLLHTAWMVTSPESHRWSHLSMKFLKPSLLPLRVPQGHMQLHQNCFSNGLGGLTDSPVRV